MKLEWEQSVAVDPGLRSLMQAAADAAALREGLQREAAAHVRLCRAKEIHEINAAYRGVDRATDVLSFPTGSYPEARTAGECQALLREGYADELNACFLGDIVISVEHIYAQAREYGHSPEREAAYLLTHGLCHLFGYDHMEDADKTRMRKMEESILESIGQARDGGAVSDEALLELAREARKRSYSPYSHYAVGAALLCADGRVFQGCNIENASFGLTNCAERTALFKAVSEGASEFTAVAIASEGSAPWPCGACRQVLNEFAPGIRVLVTWNGQVAEAPLSELLPHGFGPKDLQ